MSKEKTKTKPKNEKTSDVNGGAEKKKTEKKKMGPSTTIGVGQGNSTPNATSYRPDYPMVDPEPHLEETKSGVGPIKLYYLGLGRVAGLGGFL